MKPTDRERELLLAYLETANIEAAAHRLGIAVQTAKNTMLNARRVAGVKNTAQLVYIGAREGWLRSRELG